jgi:hypothetical protein
MSVRARGVECNILHRLKWERVYSFSKCGFVKCVLVM